MKIINYLNETQKLNWRFCPCFSVRHTFNQKNPASKKKDLIARHVANIFYIKTEKVNPMVHGIEAHAAYQPNLYQVCKK